MENLSLILAAEADLTVKSFSVKEALSVPFDLEIRAITPSDNLPFEAIVGHKASFRVVSPWPGAAPRTWTGVVHRIEQIDAEAGGATTYAIHVAPALWRLTKRTNCRIFQHLSIPEIAARLLAEYEIAPLLRLDLASFARHEYRVQYGETDFAFLSRLLEEAGIAYLFEDAEAHADGAEPPWSQVVLAEDASRREPRAASLHYWNTKDLPNDREAVACVRAARELRAGRATVRDFDFRQRPRHKLFASTGAASEAEGSIEMYEYTPGAFVLEPTAADARIDEREAQARADKALAAERGGRFAVSYRTNVLDLAPGVVFSMHGHPHPDLHDKRALLVTSHCIEGTREGEWTVTGQAHGGDEPHRPARRTAKPKVVGVQSAFVVGPDGEEIHTDAMGRVRVEFHWDREGKSDERSSCFLRVSQAWAGPGYGIVAVPRVGEEVLVSFFDGDPDQPVIVGRVHNGAAPPPQPLPASKTKTVWRTNSTPGGGGYNELALDDKKGEELVALRAERDYERNVLREERAAIGASLTTKIGAGEMREVQQDQAITVHGSRTITIDGSDSLSVGESLSIDLGGNAGGTFSKDKRIVLSTGEASLVLDGPNLYIDAKAVLSLRSGDTLSLSGSDVAIDGGPNVKLNSSQAAPPSIGLLDGSFLNLDLKLPEDAPPLHALASLISAPLADPGLAPGEISIPPQIEGQLAAYRNKILAGVEEVVGKIEHLPDQIGQDVLPEVLAAEAAAKAKIESARAWLEQAKARAAAEIAQLKGELSSLKAKLEGAVTQVKDTIQGTVAQVKERIQNAIDTVKGRIQAIRDKARDLLQNVKNQIQSFKEQVKSKFDELKAQAIEFKNKIVGPFEEIRSEVKQLTLEVKDTINEVKQTITGIVDDVKKDIQQVKDTVQKIKDEVHDLFGLKSAFNEAKKEVKDAVDGAKQAFKEVKQEVKDAVDGAKQAFKEAKQEVKDAVNDAKQAFKDAKQEVKDAVNDAKKEAKDAVSDAKQAWSEAKQDGKDALKDAGDIFKSGSKHAGANPGVHLPSGNGLHVPGGNGQAGNFHVPGGNGAANAGRGALHLPAGASQAGPQIPMHAQAMSGHGLSAQSLGGGSLSSGSAGDSGFDLQQAVSQAGDAARSNGQSASAVAGALPQNALHGSTVITRAGGFTPDGIADAVNAAHTPTMLQSPSEGQLLILRTQEAVPLSSQDLTHAFVEGQMDGLSSSDSFASALQSKGYLVYERPWDSWLTSMIKKVVL